MKFCFYTISKKSFKSLNFSVIKKDSYHYIFKNNLGEVLFKFNKVDFVSFIQFIIFQKYFSLKPVMDHLFYTLYFLNFGSILEIQLKGLGYKMLVTKDNKYLKLRLGYSHIILYKLSPHVFIKGYKGRFLFFALTKKSLKDLLSTLNRFKKINLYKGSGFIVKGSDLKLKDGKKK